MLWIKGLHVISMVTWFAGLFYLPRLFVYHAQSADALSQQRFAVMERRLYVLMTIGAALTAGFGIWMIADRPSLLSAGWLHVKLLLVAGLIVYHVWCWRLHRALAEGRDRHSPRWFKMFNEIPSLALIAIVLLAVVKPF